MKHLRQRDGLYHKPIRRLDDRFNSLHPPIYRNNVPLHHLIEIVGPGLDCTPCLRHLHPIPQSIYPCRLAVQLLGGARERWRRLHPTALLSDSSKTPAGVLKTTQHRGQLQATYETTVTEYQEQTQDLSHNLSRARLEAKRTYCICISSRLIEFCFTWTPLSVLKFLNQVSMRSIHTSRAFPPPFRL